jgi:phenylalanyl-tRNA synthetase alpha chain
MKEQLEQIYQCASADIEKAATVKDLEDVKFKYLSRKGEFNEIKKGLKDLSPDDKRVVGALANDITQKLETSIKEKFQLFYEAELNKKLESEKLDITLPGQYIPRGKVHPLTSTTNEIVSIFQSLGFSVAPNENSPEVETEYFNFDMLNVPKDHPARDMQDTFYTDVASNVVLRSQTSGAQIHVMENQKPPIRIIAPGRVYRNENINSRKNNFFHQIEGLYVDKDITFGDLKGVLNEFIRIYFGASRPTRFRSSFFPFTEPSAEVDVQCIMCEGKGCRTCSGTGWLEILGSGMVDPNVLRGVGIDPDVYTGFAFGMGVERLAMLKYAVDDIRLFFNNDVRFLEQFKG